MFLMILRGPQLVKTIPAL